MEIKQYKQNSLEKINKNIKIAHIVKEDGKSKSIENINQDNNMQLSTLKYNSLVTAIPANWKKELKKNCNLEKIEKAKQNNTEPEIKSNGKMIKLTKLTTKNIYETLISKKIEEGTAIEKWINRFPILHDIEWSEIYKRGFKITTEPYLQSFQYKVIQGILNCNYNLYNWTIKDSSKCLYCDETDTIEHRLYSCEQSKLFWRRLEEWITDNMECSFPLTVCEVLFGMNSNNDPNIKIINYLILIGKWYINNTKQNETALFFIDFLQIVQGKVSTLLHANQINNRKTEQWQQIFGDALMIPEPEIVDDQFFFSHMSIYHYLPTD